jgi:ATP/maltotriose-dependent transcriptional regulator MalT
VARPRLSGRLRRGAESRLTLISAPAGFGKTTLLVEWLAATGTARSVAWLSLEESDSQPASYWTYLITALQATIALFRGDHPVAVLAAIATAPIFVWELSPITTGMAVGTA